MRGASPALALSPLIFQFIDIKTLFVAAIHDYVSTDTPVLLCSISRYNGGVRLLLYKFENREATHTAINHLKRFVCLAPR